jgi:CheY-like chemotaxis protein
VLCIGDNDDNVYMLKMRLELLGDFEVLTAQDGEKGCEMAAAEQPDIILMDFEMGGRARSSCACDTPHSARQAGDLQI